MENKEAINELQEHLQWVSGFKWYTLPEETQAALNHIITILERVEKLLQMIKDAKDGDKFSQPEWWLASSIRDFLETGEEW